MMRIALFTGMRRGEMFKLKWDDIDFHKGFISLRDPKGKEPQKIPLNDSAKTVFESIPRHKSGFVFTMNNGRPFTTDLRRRLNRIRDKAKIPEDFRALHGLRHVYAQCWLLPVKLIVHLAKTPNTQEPHYDTTIRSLVG
jgi:integrase